MGLLTVRMCGSLTLVTALAILFLLLGSHAWYDMIVFPSSYYTLFFQAWLLSLGSLYFSTEKGRRWKERWSNEGETTIWIHFYKGWGKVVQELKASHAEKAKMSWNVHIYNTNNNYKAKQNKCFVLNLSSINFMRQTRHFLIGFKVLSFWWNPYLTLIKLPEIGDLIVLHL